MNTDQMILELNRLEVEKEKCLRKFYSQKNLISENTSFKLALLEIMQLCCSIQRKTIELIRRYEEDVEIIKSEIAYLQSTREQHDGETRAIKRKKKKKCLHPNSFFSDNEFYSHASEARSSYFHSESERCGHENGDFLDMHALGYKFVGRLRMPRVWIQDDRKRLLNAVRHQIKCINLNKLTELYTKLQRTDEEKIVSSLFREACELTQHLENGSMNRDLLQAATISTKEIDWNYISEKYFENRRNPLELQSMWTLVVNSSVHMKKWTREEDILLKCLAVEHNYQDWDRINESMPTSRNGFVCFSRFSFVYKQRRPTDRRKSRKVDTNMKTKKIGHFSKREKFVVYNYLRRGYSYNSIANMLQNRSKKQISEHDHMSIKRRNRKVWTRNEDNDLIFGVKYLGKGNWKFISRYMSRTPDQCRQRFNFLIRYKRRHVDTRFTYKYGTAKSLLAKMRKFISKKNQKSQINYKVESYFVMELMSRKESKIRERDTLTEHAFNLLKFLNLEVQCASQYDEFNKWLAAYPSSSGGNKLAWNIFFLDEFAKLRKKRENLPMKMVNHIFSHVVNKSSQVLPPSKSTIEGLFTFMQNYESYFQKNNEINFREMWKEQNAKYFRKKYFNESKILWYYVLKAIFFWPLKLKAFAPDALP